MNACQRLRLPVVLANPCDDQAVQVVQDYMAKTSSGSVAYTGSLFDSWDGGGSDPRVRDAFTDADINAVAMLSVEIHPRAVIEILTRRGERLSQQLANIPSDVDLHDASSDLVGPKSAAWCLYEQLLDIKHVKWVTAHKLCARKRPRLLPAYDRRTKAVVGVNQRYFWESLRCALRADDAALAGRLERIRQKAGATNLSVARTFDVLAWMPPPAN